MPKSVKCDGCHKRKKAEVLHRVGNIAGGAATAVAERHPDLTAESNLCNACRLRATRPLTKGTVGVQTEPLTSK